MNTGNTTQRKRRWLIGIPAGIVLLTVLIFAVIPPLVMPLTLKRMAVKK